MKKILFSILLCIFILPVVVNAASCDTSKVYIDSINLENTNGTAIEVEEATAVDKTIGINLEMFQLNDSVRYKIVIKNDSNEDYELDQKSIKISSNYIDYSIESDGSNIIKSKSSQTVYLSVQYKNQVPDSAYENGAFNDTVTMKVDLSSGDNIPNPSTGIKYYFILALIIIICGLLSLLFRKKASILIMIGILLIPLSVNALCKCQIELKSVVSIKKPVYNGIITRASSTDLVIGDTIDFNKIKCIDGNCNYIDENEYQNKRIYIKHEVENNIIKSAYVCKENVCLKGATTTDFENNKQIFFTLHSESNCEITDTRVYSRESDDYIESNGNVRLGSYCGECFVDSNGLSSCSNLDAGIC